MHLPESKQSSVARLELDQGWGTVSGCSKGSLEQEVKCTAWKAYETGTSKIQPGNVGSNPSLCFKLANTAELIAVGYVPTPVKTDVHAVILLHEGKKF